MGGKDIAQDDKTLFGAIESGGTKIVCLVGSGPADIRAERTLPTSTPETSLRDVIGFFEESQREFGDIAAIGLASFGPLDRSPGSPTFGHVTRTPKEGWSGVDVVGRLKRALDRPIAFDTDVNGAGIGEYEWGAGQGLSNFVYVTIGTGIGGGIILDGKPLSGLSHPELGHLRPHHDWQRDPFPGVCPFHGDCLEGLASGSAIVARWDKTLEELGSNRESLLLEADYLAYLCAELTYLVSPQTIILGGGVANARGLLPAVRRQTGKLLSGYPSDPLLSGTLDDYIVEPKLGKRAGALGALAMARRLIRECDG
jgi:fructokinase